MEVSFYIEGKPHAFVRGADGKLSYTQGDPRIVEMIASMGDFSSTALSDAVAQVGGSRLEIIRDKVGEKIDQYLMDQSIEMGFSGACLVVQKNDILVQKGYGFADREKCISNCTDTTFRLASLTKAMTAYAILRLVEAKELSLSDRIDQFFPSACLLRPKWKEISIEMLVNHTSGIGKTTDYVPSLESPILCSYQPLEHFVQIFSRKEVFFSPGTHFHYGHPNYLMLTAILEEISQQPYDQIMQEMVFNPFDLSSTYAPTSTNNDLPMAKGYLADDQEANINDVSSRIGSGNIISSITDLRNWMQGWQDPNHIDPDLIQKIFQPDPKPIHTQNHQKEFYAYGWKHRMVDNHRALYHTGNMKGCRNLILFFPKDEILIILLCNKDFPSSHKGHLIEMGKHLFLQLNDTPHM